MRLPGGKGVLAMAGPAGTVLPIYFVADCSGSMGGEPLNEVNKGLTSLLDALQSEAMAAAKVRFAVIGFDDVARCYLEPSDLREIENMPVLQLGGTTSYAAAFAELARRMPLDIASLKGAGYLVNRPAVFFLTDGVPNRGDGWEGAYAGLMSQKWRPNVLAFGIGDADPGTITQLASAPEYAFAVAQGVDTGHAIAKFVKALTKSVIKSGQALAGGQAALPLEKPEGFISLAVDTI